MTRRAPGRLRCRPGPPVTAANSQVPDVKAALPHGPSFGGGADGHRCRVCRPLLASRRAAGHRPTARRVWDHRLRRFQLVLAAQPCPCAIRNGADPCTCTDLDRRRYLARMAGLWQRTDIRLHLDAMNPHNTAAGESSAVVAARVAAAREHAADRWAALGYRVNAEIPGKILRTGVCALPTCDLNPLLHLRRVGAVSDDGHDRILRIAWTLCDLRSADRPDLDDVTAAIDLHIDRQP
jgi:hypothetical protein